MLDLVMDVGFGSAGIYLDLALTFYMLKTPNGKQVGGIRYVSPGDNSYGNYGN